VRAPSRPVVCINSIKVPGKEALRNKVDWIVDFIHCSALAYRYKECLKCNATVPSKLIEMPVSKEQAVNMDTVKQTIANLEVKV
jgi:hypothetical protein